MNRPCRHLVNGKPCRRTIRHVIHHDHELGCHVPPAQHHAYVAPRKVEKKQESDPFVRTSMRFRRSDLTYLTSTYGSAANKLREWIAADRGITGNALKRHIPVWRKHRAAGGKFAPVPKTLILIDDPIRNDPFIVDDPHVLPEERPARAKVIEAFENARTVAAIKQHSDWHMEYGTECDDYCDFEPNTDSSQQEVGDDERASVIADMQRRVEAPGTVGHVPPAPDDDDEELAL